MHSAQYTLQCTLPTSVWSAVDKTVCPVCQEDWRDCQEDLGDCQEDLGDCQEDLGDCQGDCQEDWRECQEDLGDCLMVRETS